MSLLSENVIPGNYGKVFGTNAKDESDLKRIKLALLEIKGITNVMYDMDEFPRELTVLTDDVVSVKDIEKAVANTGFHVIPKDLFNLF